jgi:hypothetical protein
MEYNNIKNTWSGISHYNLNGPQKINKPSQENYSGPVTLSLPEWKNYVASGKHVLYGSGGVIPGGTVSTPFGGGGAVYSGHVRQGYK